MTSQATAAQVRQSYKAEGYDVRIARDGNITFRDADCIAGTPWHEGRWVSEYNDNGTDIALR